MFQRFAIMKHWVERDNIPFEAMLSPDGLHMNDWSYACIAKLLGTAIAEAATRPIAAASVHPAMMSAKPDGAWAPMQPCSKMPQPSWPSNVTRATWSHSENAARPVTAGSS